MSTSSLYRGDYPRKRNLVVKLANANPHAVCCHCARTLAQHPPHADGTPVEWTGGHNIDDVDGPAWTAVTQMPPSTLPCIAPAERSCNYGHKREQAARIVTSRKW